MKILSVDFDYFIATDLYTRNNLFPDGVDFADKKTTQSEWKLAYTNYPKIKDIGVISDYFKFKEFLSHNSFTAKLFSENHKDIISFIQKNCSPKDMIELVNVDFHHDNYISSGNKLDCANWLRFFAEKYTNNKITWVKRKDSETKSMVGEFPYTIITGISKVLKDRYDFLFICFSPEWTPPHLRKYYLDLL